MKTPNVITFTEMRSFHIRENRRKNLEKPLNKKYSAKWFYRLENSDVVF